NDLSRPQKQLRLQRLHHFLVPGFELAPRPHAPLVPLQPPPRPRRPRTTNHAQSFKAGYRCGMTCSPQRRKGRKGRRKENSDLDSEKTICILCVLCGSVANSLLFFASVFALLAPLRFNFLTIQE